MEDDNELVEAITPDVLRVLRGVLFFEALDDRMCPVDPEQPRASCQSSYAISTAVLTERGFNSEEIGEIIQVLAAAGAHCDCEILFNVAEDSRLKSEYWKSRAARHLPT